MNKIIDNIIKNEYKPGFVTNIKSKTFKRFSLSTSFIKKLNLKSHIALFYIQIVLKAYNDP